MAPLKEYLVADRISFQPKILFVREKEVWRKSDLILKSSSFMQALYAPLTRTNA